MAHTRAWSNATPADTDPVGDGAQEVRNVRTDTDERMSVDHYWGDETAAVAGQDGQHRQVTLKAVTKPTNLAGAGIVYAKTEGSDIELHYEDEEGTDTQLTTNGSLGKAGQTILGNIDGIGSGSFLRSDATDTYSGGELLVEVADEEISALTTQNTLQVKQTATGKDAFMSFHCVGDYAVHFGLDHTTNDLAVGGWSMGANKYKVWHAGNLIAQTIPAVFTSTIAVLTGTLDETTYYANDTGTESYPAGFAQANCVVLASGVSDGTYYWEQTGTGSSAYEIALSGTTVFIMLSAAASTLRGGAYRIVLMRIS